MLREISSGGVVLRKGDTGWDIAVIEPQKDSPVAAPVSDPALETQAKTAPAAKKKPPKAVYALPKGLVDPGEKPDQTAIREVFEETGIVARLVGKLADTKYVYTRKWSDHARVFKIVSFYLLMYESGDIDNIEPEMRIEVKRALWMPFTDAVKKLSYSTEKKSSARRRTTWKSLRRRHLIIRNSCKASVLLIQESVDCSVKNRGLLNPRKMTALIDENEMRVRNCRVNLDGNSFRHRVLTPLNDQHRA